MLIKKTTKPLFSEPILVHITVVFLQAEAHFGEPVIISQESEYLTVTLQKYESNKLRVPKATVSSKYACCFVGEIITFVFHMSRINDAFSCCNRADALLYILYISTLQNCEGYRNNKKCIDFSCQIVYNNNKCFWKNIPE